MSPVEDDPSIWAILLKPLKLVADSLSFTTPFLGPAFVGAVLSTMRKSYRKKGKMYWFSAVSWSTAAGAMLTPLFAHLAGIPENVAGSTAAFVAIMGHEALGFICRYFGSSEPWDGEERRETQRGQQEGMPEQQGREQKGIPGQQEQTSTSEPPEGMQK